MSLRPPTPGGNLPPPSQMRPNLVRKKQGGSMFGSLGKAWSASPSGLKINIVGSFLMLLVLFCGGWQYYRYMTTPAEPPPTPAPARVEVDLSANPTTAPAVLTDTAKAETQEEVVTGETDNGAIGFNGPDMAVPDFGTRLLVGSVILGKEFGYCEVSNIGFSASGQPYWLWIDIDKIPDVDLSRTQLQVEGVIVAAPPPCDHPMLKVTKVNVAGGQIEPPDYLLATETPNITSPRYITKTDGTTATMTPQPIEVMSKQEYLASVPLRDQNGNVIATAVTTGSQQNNGGGNNSPAPTATPIQINVFGSLTTISNCLESNFGAATNNGEYILLFQGGSALPSPNQIGLAITVVGGKAEVCGRSAIKVISISFAPVNTPTPSATPVPTSIANATKTPYPTSTPSIVTLSGRLLTNAQGCNLTSFALQSDNGIFYYLSIANPPANLTEQVIVTGIARRGCDNYIIEVTQLILSTPTALPSITPTGTLTPTKVAATPTMVVVTATSTPIPTATSANHIPEQPGETGGGTIEEPTGE